MGDEYSPNINLPKMEGYGATPISDTSTRAGRARKAPGVIRNTNDPAIKTAWNLANDRWSIDPSNITYQVAPTNYYYANGLHNARPIGTRPGGRSDGYTHDDMDNLVEDLIHMDNEAKANINKYGKPRKIANAINKIFEDNNCTLDEAIKIFKELVMKYNVAINHINKDAAYLKENDKIEIPLDANGGINIDKMKAYTEKKNSSPPKEPIKMPDIKTPPPYQKPIVMSPPPPQKPRMTPPPPVMETPPPPPPQPSPSLPADGIISNILHMDNFYDHDVVVHTEYGMEVSGLTYLGQPVVKIEVGLRVTSESRYSEFVSLYFKDQGSPLTLKENEASEYMIHTHLKFGYKGKVNIVPLLDIPLTKDKIDRER